MGLIETKIAELKNSLQWKTKTIHNTKLLEIVSDPEKLTHFISLPVENKEDPLRPIEYLHELCHAKLAETAHPLFSGSYFSDHTDPRLYQFYTPLFRAVNDWFVDGLLMQLCPEEEKSEIEESLELITNFLENGKSGNLFHFFSSALILAQADYHLDLKLNTVGMLSNAIKNFVSIDPHHPTIENSLLLHNSLLETIGADYRLYLIEEDGLEVWRFKRISNIPTKIEV